jgi:activating signal cointegrator complex subunit 3
MHISHVLEALCEADEYSELPVRHNEDKLNESLLEFMRIPLSRSRCDSPHLKANILLQARFSVLPLPITDYYTDTNFVLDQSIRIMQAMIDICAEAGWLKTCLKTMNLAQMVVQGRWPSDSTLLNLPHMTDELIFKLWNDHNIQCLPELIATHRRKQLIPILNNLSNIGTQKINQMIRVIESLPLIKVDILSTFDKPIEIGNEIVIEASFERINQRKTAKVYAPRWSKHNDEGFWLIIGNERIDELFALKRLRIPLHSKAFCSLRFMPAEVVGNQSVSLYLISDSYLGLDQQYQVNFTIQDSISSKFPSTRK